MGRPPSAGIRLTTYSNLGRCVQDMGGMGQHEKGVLYSNLCLMIAPLSADSARRA